MPDLLHSLQGRDIGHLRIVAELWGLDFSAPDARVGVQRLAPLLLDAGSAAEAVAALPGTAQMALGELLAHEGRLPLALFERRFGALRKMGAARRDRERPYENRHANATESLYYRALVAFDTFDTPAGPEATAYIPDDLLALLPAPVERPAALLGRPATSAERALILPAGDRILDDATTLLAALRLGAVGHAPDLSDWFTVAPLAPYPLTPAALAALLDAAGLLDANGQPRPEPVRQFLEAERGAALLMLVQAWLDSPRFNDLRQIPTLQVEGDWYNDALAARRTVLEALLTLRSADSFWSLPAFVAAMRQANPDFQRPGGDYDSYYLKDAASGAFLRGFEHWDAVDGELLRFIIAGPMHWLGLVDLGMPGDGAGRPKTGATAFRLSALGGELLRRTPPRLGVEAEPLVAGANGRLHIPARTARAARYQLARCAAWDKQSRELYHYRLTPASLEAARKQGLRVEHVLALLRRYAPGLPPSLVLALERWEAQGSQARLEPLTILRVKDPAILAALRESRAARFLGELIGPTVAIVRPGAVDKVLDALAELGYIGEII